MSEPESVFSIHLVDRLAALPSALFSQLMLVLDLPPGILPSEMAPQRLRAIEMIRYFQQPGRTTTTIMTALATLATGNLPLTGTGIQSMLDEASEAIAEMSRAYVAAAVDLQSCAPGREDFMNLEPFRRSVESARWAVRRLSKYAEGDYLLEARWLAAWIAYTQGSIYQERNTQRRIKSERTVSSQSDMEEAIRNYLEALDWLGDPPIDTKMGAKVHFDLALQRSRLGRSTPNLQSALDSYGRVLSLDPGGDLAEKAMEEIERILTLMQMGR